ncbi:fructan beta-fructosidase [Lewinella aquimaris]|uniref:Fructan beta-fructosidase n=1 Tax=Neolewinella aquimaris TaxID=1835722 RepID=A0A840E6D4_9BACT|nr:glycoside hydrolase family 32 protein [Neolewinella aquimaris]MBB4078757.1 fructan beta-fructosidase [Neolewinella aquimaris]
MKDIFTLFPTLLLLGLFACGPTAPSELDGTMPDANQPTAEYNEQHRPQVHFSPPTQWMNDPNGMVYLDGEYHLFYQHYPDSNVWGPMHWGHAVSEDLVHWENLPIALYPDSLGWIFSGSAVVDHGNTSGLGEDGKDPLIAIFTYHNDKLEKEGRNDFQYQGIAYSNDRGRSWTKYAGNPVVPNTQPIRDFRDPKVIWDEERSRWLMVFAAQDHVMLWSSDNLIDWEHLSDFGTEIGAHGGVWECPDFFPIQVEGSEATKWVLLLSINPGGPNGGSATQYFVGEFDGTDFTLDPDFAEDLQNTEAIWLDYGRDNYAGVTWSDVPEADGRRIFIGWMSNWDYARDVPTTVWRSAMTVPRKLELHRVPEGLRVFSNPVRELTELRTVENTLRAGTFSESVALETIIDSGSDPISGAGHDAYELILEFELVGDDQLPFGVELANGQGETYRVGYDPARKEFFSDRTKSGKNDFSEKFAAEITRAPRLGDAKTLRMHLIFDRASAELFADGGATVITDIFFPTEQFDQISLFGEGSKLIGGSAYALSSIWAEPM